MKRFYPLLILLLLTVAAQAFASGVIKGIVTDKRTGEPLIGSTVTVKNETSGKKTSASVGLDGSFIFRNLAAGNYEVEARYVSYKDEETHVNLIMVSSSVRKFYLDKLTRLGVSLNADMKRYLSGLK